MKFMGRDEEIERIRTALEGIADGPQLVVVTGEARSGKTAVVRRALAAQALPSVTVLADPRRDEAELARELALRIRARFNLEEGACPARGRLREVLADALRLSAAGPFIIVIDGMDEAVPGLEWSEVPMEASSAPPEAARLGLVLSGLRALEAADRMTGAWPFGSPVHVEVRPFGPARLKRLVGRYQKKPDAEDLLMLHAVTGGMPRYLEMLVDEEALSAGAVLRHLFSKRGEGLRAMAELRLVARLGSVGSVYWRILEAAALGPSEWTELERAAGGGQISPYVDRLERQYGLLGRPGAILGSPRRGVRYEVKDRFLRTWLAFVSPPAMRARIDAGEVSEALSASLNRREWFLERALVEWFGEVRREAGCRVGEWRAPGTGGLIALAVLDEAEGRFELCDVARRAVGLRPERLAERAERFLRAAAASKDPALRAASRVKPLLKCLTLEDVLRK